jgi:hypothetical protein
MVRLILTAILLVLLTACGTVGLEPSSQLVQRALRLQLEQTQQQLSQQLSLNFKGFEISQLVINQQEPLVVQDLPAYHVRGTYDLTLKLPRRRVTQPQNPFDIYLQRQKEGKTWRLALPQSSSKDNNLTWRTYLIQQW